MKHKHYRRWRDQGNVLAFLIATLALLLAVGLFVINYTHILGVNKEATSAIDAAALAVARDMTQAVVNCPVGRIGLIDDASAKQSYDTMSIQTFGANSPFKSDPRPIYSINTIKAVLRLDALIASNPKVNNQSMLWLLKQHLAFVDGAEQLLRQQIIAKRIYDKFGNPHDLQESAYESYNQFNRKTLGKGLAAVAKEDIVLEFGGNKQTNDSGCPCPQPAGLDTATSGQVNYLTDSGYSVPGVSGSTIQFLPMSRSISLINPSSYKALSAAETPVSVKVTVKQPVKPMIGVGSKDSHELQIAAYAQAAVGNINNHFPTGGTLVITFPAGVPSGTFNDPSTGNFPELAFNSVTNIMNASQVSSATENGTSPYSRWHKDSKGQWSTAINGPVPWTGGSSNGAYTPQNFLGPPSTTGKSGVSDSDPSVALSFLVVDWLRTLGVRPNVTSVVNALSFDYQSAYINSGNSTPRTISSNTTNYSDRLLPPVYANTEEANGQSAAVLRLSDTGEGDPRNLDNWSEDPSLYNRQQARMWGYIPADGVLPSDAKVAWVQANGNITTVDGHPVSDLNDLLNAIVQTDTLGMQTFNNAIAVIKQLTNGKPDEKAIQQLFNEKPALMRAVQNASYCTQIAIMMKVNLKALSSLGVKKLNDRHFVVAGADFFPPTKAATETELLSGAGSDTGQDSMASIRDWCAAPLIKNGTPESSLTFYKHKSEPVIGSVRREKQFLPPALAATADQTNFHQFVFRLVNNTSDGTNGLIQIVPQKVSPYGVVPCLKGQAHYQSVNALNMKAPNDPDSIITWQVQARDQNANAYAVASEADAAPKPNESVQYFTDISGGSYDTQWCQDKTGTCPVIACEWALSCPLIKAPPPVPQPTQPPVTPPIPHPDCSEKLMSILTSRTGYDIEKLYLGMGAKMQLKNQENAVAHTDGFWTISATKFTYQLILNGAAIWTLPPVYQANSSSLNRVGENRQHLSWYEWDMNLAAKTANQALGWVWPTCDPKPYAAHI